MSDQNNQPERFSQAVINTAKLLAITYHRTSGPTLAYGTATFEGGQTVNIPASDARTLIEQYPNKACRCNAIEW
jgi:hypothetical protein